MADRDEEKRFAKPCRSAAPENRSQGQAPGTGSVRATKSEAVGKRGLWLEEGTRENPEEQAIALRQAWEVRPPPAATLKMCRSW